MATTAKIKTIHKCTKRERDGKVVFFHDVEFDNWDRGSRWKAKENAFTVWEEHTYNLEDTATGGKKIIEVKENAFKQGGWVKGFNINGILLSEAVKVATMEYEGKTFEDVIGRVTTAYNTFKWLTS